MTGSRIYYFTSTGNSLAAARRISSGLGDCELVPMVKALNEPALLDCKNKTAGFVFPVYYLGIPNMVREFLEKASFSEAEYLFVVTTCGHPFGVANSQVNKILKKKKAGLSYGRYLAMPDNYLPYYSMPPEKAAGIIAKADPVLDGIISDIKASKKKIAERTLIFAPLMNLFNGRWAARYRDRDRKFVWHLTCNSCGICVKVCPARNVILKDKHPFWRHKCEHCFACAHFCPKGAIEYEKKTMGKIRYHHPEVTAEDIAAQK